MIGFPAVYGGHSTLMSPTAFIRRPQRWIQALHRTHHSRPTLSALVIIAERAAGTGRSELSVAIAAIRDEIATRHGFPACDVHVVSPGSILRTTSGKLA